VPETAAPRSDTSVATLALLDESRRAEATGDLAESVAYVERAIRISPRQADLWVRRARLALRQNDPNGAIQFAQKALTLAGSRVDWQRDAWLVIADAEDARGNSAEAAAIRERWRTERG
jgi:tetratricopeptide (TPR) repeat protein